MTIKFPHATTLFAAVATTRSSPEDEVLVKHALSKKTDDPDLTDEEIAAVIREAMRSGLKQLYLGLEGVNGAELEVLAHRLRQAGFDAEANPELPLWAMCLLMRRCRGVRIRWNPKDLTAKLSEESATEA